jgi:hypothetical protein
MKDDKSLDLIRLLIQFLIHDLSIYTSELEPVWLDRTRPDETGFWPVHDIEIDIPRSKNQTKNPIGSNQPTKPDRIPGCGPTFGSLVLESDGILMTEPIGEFSPTSTTN